MKITKKRLKQIIKEELVVLDENMFADLKTNINKWANPGSYEDRSSDAFIEKRFNEAYELLNAARSIIHEFDAQMAGKIMDIEHEVMNMRNAHRSDELKEELTKKDKKRKKELEKELKAIQHK